MYFIILMESRQISLLCLVAASLVGCKNEENKSSLPSLARGLFDGTMKCNIKKDRKLNKNNTSGVRGVHFDKDRWLWVAQIMFKRKPIILADLKLRRKKLWMHEKLAKINILKNIDKMGTFWL